MVTCEQKAMLVPGGITEQPTWFIKLMAWFAPAYDMLKFMHKAKMILGDGSPSPAKNSVKRSK